MAWPAQYFKPRSVAVQVSTKSISIVFTIKLIFYEMFGITFYNVIVLIWIKNSEFHFKKKSLHLVDEKEKNIIKS
jgi:hypothetical protein